jgi:YVTN family beta-propeller protein
MGQMDSMRQMERHGTPAGQETTSRRDHTLAHNGKIPAPRTWRRRTHAALQGTLVVCAVLAVAGPIPAPVFAQAVTYTTYTLPYTYGIHPRGVAVNTATHKIYDTYTWIDEAWYSGQEGNVLEVLDGATNTYLASVSIGSPDFDEVGGVAVNSTTNTVYVANTYSGTLSVIDGATNAVVEFPAGDRPYAVAVNPTTNSVYITVSTSASGGAGVVVLNGATNAITATVPLGGVPTDLAVDPATNRVYVAYGGTVAVLDGTTNAVTATVPVGGGSGGVAVDPATHKVDAVSYGDGTVAVLDGATNVVTATVPVGDKPGGVAVDLDTHTIYVTRQDASTVVIDGATNRVTASIPAAATPPQYSPGGVGAGGVGVDPVTRSVYVAVYYGTVGMVNLDRLDWAGSLWVIAPTPASATGSATPTPIATSTASATASATPTQPPTTTPTPSPTATPTPSLSPTPTPSATPTATASPTPTPTASPTAIPTPSATATTEPPNQMTVTFDDLTHPNRALKGQYPTGVIDWGTNRWYLSVPRGVNATNSVRFNGPGYTSKSITLVTPRRLVGLTAFNGGSVKSVVSAVCSGEAQAQIEVIPNQQAALVTNWNGTCTTVSIGSSNGWDTTFDNLVLE